MSLHLVLPGLLWPSASPLPPPNAPALSRLIGCGKPIVRPAQAPEHLLASLFGLDGHAPLAALRRTGSGENADQRHWLAADASHLRFARDALLLTDAPDVAPDAEEAAALAASWNAHFANVGWLHLGSGGHGHIALLDAIEADTTPPGATFGRKIDNRLPSGRDGAKLRQWMNETQMLFHSHAVNAAREEAGRPVINSLWFWGAGALPVSPGSTSTARNGFAAPPPYIQLWSDNALARGLALSAGVRAAPLPPHTAVALQPGNVIVLEHALQPSFYLDAEGWTQAVQMLETRWITPALDALKRGEVQSLTLTLSGDDARLDLTVQRRDLWKFWRRPRPVTGLHIAH
jgi:hypothetical protein